MTKQLQERKYETYCILAQKTKNKHDIMVLLIDQPASISLLKFHFD